MTLDDIVAALEASKQSRDALERTWCTVYPQLLDACKQALAHGDISTMANGFAHLGTTRLSPTKQTWLQTYLHVCQ